MDSMFSENNSLPSSDLNLRLFGRQVYVAFVDILGFKAAMDYDLNQKVDHQNTIYSLWRNCVIPQRSKLYFEYNEFLNFVQFSDCIVFYGTDPNHLIDLVSDFFGWCFSWGVPVRGGLGYGQVFHSETLSGLGSSIMINGQGLIDAHATEQNGKGLGMRLLVSQAFLGQTKSLNFSFKTTSNDRSEFPWWMRSGHDKSYFLNRSQDWWNVKQVGKWFNGSHREDTEKVFQSAIEELK